jgi:hypothetical protein
MPDNRFTATESFNELQYKVQAILRKIKEGQSLHGELREALKVAAKHRLLALAAKQFNLNRKQDRLDLVTLAEAFLVTPMITKSTLKERFWTDTLIAKYLPTPDVETKNPHYKSAAPMRLYVLTRIELLEQQEDVKTALQKVASQRGARSNGALKASEKKRQELLDWVTDLNVSIPQLELDTLLRDAVRHYGQLWSDRSRDGYSEKSANLSDAPEFLARITTNYLRHDCTNYEQQLDQLSGKVGCAEAYQYLKDKINNVIAATYPDLEGAIADWQADRLKAKEIEAQKRKEFNEARKQMDDAYYAEDPGAAVHSLLPELKQLAQRSSAIKPKKIKAFKRDLQRFLQKLKRRFELAGIDFQPSTDSPQILLEQLQRLSAERGWLPAIALKIEACEAVQGVEHGVQ